MNTSSGAPPCTPPYRTHPPPLRQVEGDTQSEHGRTFGPGNQIQFTVRVPSELSQGNYGLLLRRLFDYSAYNQKAAVAVNGRPVGTWMSLGGNPLSRLGESDLLIAPEFTQGEGELRFTVQPQSPEWLDVAYSVFVLH